MTGYQHSQPLLSFQKVGTRMNDFSATLRNFQTVGEHDLATHAFDLLVRADPMVGT
jgi:hypothetical protein